MNSVWTKSKELPSFPQLSGDISVDVCVVGGGIAGLLTAYKLTKRGYEVCVLEAETVCSGATSMTTAKVTSQHGVIYSKIENTYGEEAARVYAAANQNAIIEYDRIINEKGIDCDWVRIPHTVFSLKGSEELINEASSARKAGIECEIIKNTDLPLPVASALRFYEQAMFDPFKFVCCILPGLRVFEHTRVDEIKDGMCITEKGKVSAKHIVVTTHYPFINTPGWYFAKVHQERSYVIALENAPKLESMYRDADPAGLSLRNYNDLLLVGAGDHRTGENPKGGYYEDLEKQALRLFNGAKVVCKWSNQDCITPDIIPFVGEYSKNTDNIYVATGFNMWGMSNSMVSADIITGYITGEPHFAAELYSGQRFDLGGMGKELTRHGMTSAKCLLKGVTAKKGEPVCSHMGCKLCRNGDDDTWECACHGSRFDNKGNVLNGPAQKPFEV
ncbi:MAG: FAD-dependent oxidoreductase [Ruminococcaceae bacterium]|nr:FAD-dependent oxidoreductase [Oscillospiraceae bacterium]